MAGNIWLSPLNPLRFTPLNDIVSPKYNTKPFDKTSYYDYIQWWEQKTPYFYKVQRWDLDNTSSPTAINSDLIPIQLITDQQQLVTIKLLNCFGDELDSGTFGYVPNAPTSMNGTTPTFYQQYLGNLLKGNVYDDGIYYMLLSWDYDSTGSGGATDSTMEMLSEPIILADRHENTVLIEYSNEYSKDFMPFQQIAPLYMRVEGRVLDMQAKLTSTSFQNQNFNTSLLSSQAYRGWTFYIGGAGQAVPDYMIDKLNHILGLTRVLIDNKRYTIEDGGVIEKKDIENYPLVFGAIKLLEFNNLDAFKFQGKEALRIVPLYEFIPQEYPFAIFNTNVYLQSGSILFFDKYVINSEIELDIYTDAINAFAVGQGYSGTFAIVVHPNSGGLKDFVYQLGANENIAPQPPSSGIVLGNASPFVVSYSRILTGFFTLDMSAGTSTFFVEGTNSNNAQMFLIANYPTTTSIIASAIVSGIGGFTFTSTTSLVHIFYSQSIKKMNFQDMPFLKEITNRLPRNLTEFHIVNCQSIDDFAMNTLQDSKFTLSLFRIIQSNLSTISGYDTTYPNTSGWAALYAIGLFQNKLTATVLDDFFNKMYANHLSGIFNVYNGFIRVDGQIPIAALTSTSGIARANLISTYNWTIINN